MTNQLQLLFKIIKGMNLDADVLTATPDTAFRLFNIKTLTLDNNSSNVLTNEKGNSLIEVKDNTGTEDFFISGKIIGLILCTPTLIVLFTYVDNETNTIYKLEYDESNDYIKAKILASGNFEINEDAEISGIFVYENSELQKVYWVDGKNQ